MTHEDQVALGAILVIVCGPSVAAIFVVGALAGLDNWLKKVLNKEENVDNTPQTDAEIAIANGSVIDPDSGNLRDRPEGLR